MNEESRFRSEVGKSWTAVWVVARHIHALGGCAVVVLPLQLRPSFDDREGFGDVADLLVKKSGGKWKRAEVKGRKIPFTSAEDYPYATIFVDRSSKADATTPDVYFIVNDKLTYAARIDSATKDKWIGPKTYSDRTKGYDLTVYECPKDCARFFRLAA